MVSIGLYYPFIHFREDNWLKLSALYWNRMTRIVPDNYPTHDSEVVRRFKDDYGYVDDRDPGPAAEAIGERFANFVLANGDRLRQRFALPNELVETYGKSRRELLADLRTPNQALRHQYDDRIAFVYREKMAHELLQALMEAKLAVSEPAHGKWGPGEWVGMHPRLLGVYMTALAEELAVNTPTNLVADDVVNHVGATGKTLERLGELFLEQDQPAGSQVGPDEVRQTLLSLAVKTVIPKGLATVSVQQIMELRENHGTEFQAFQQYVQNLGGHPELQHLTKPEDIKLYMETIVADELTSKLKSLEGALHDANIDAVWGSVGVILLSSAGAIAATLFPPLIAGAGAVAVGEIKVLRDRTKAARTASSEHPEAAFLLRAQHQWAPRTLRRRVADAIGRHP